MLEQQHYNLGPPENYQMEKQTAITIMNLMQEVSDKLSASVNIVMTTADEKEVERHRKAVSECLGEIYFEIMSPIMEDHPDLTPHYLRSPLAQDGDYNRKSE